MLGKPGDVLIGMVSNADVDEAYDQGRAVGSLGLLHVPFKLTSSGSQVIYGEREEDYSTAERAVRGLRPFRELASDRLRQVD